MWNFLANGSGGLDWAGLPVVSELLGVQDPEGLLWRLMAIKRHRPRRDDEGNT